MAGEWGRDSPREKSREEAQLDSQLTVLAGLPASPSAMPLWRMGRVLPLRAEDTHTDVCSTQAYTVEHPTPGRTERAQSRTSCLSRFDFGELQVHSGGPGGVSTWDSQSTGTRGAQGHRRVNYYSESQGQAQGHGRTGNRNSIIIYSRA
jgi:hypothetical protein